MIEGVGVDIVDILRVERLVKEYGDRFVERVFTSRESAYAGRSKAKASERFAGRFAVKEAVMKLLGTGKSLGILWRDVETLRGDGGKPEIVLHGKAKDISAQRGSARLQRCGFAGEPWLGDNKLL